MAISSSVSDRYPGLLHFKKVIFSICLSVLTIHHTQGYALYYLWTLVYRCTSESGEHFSAAYCGAVVALNILFHQELHTNIDNYVQLAVTIFGIFMSLALPFAGSIMDISKPRSEDAYYTVIAMTCYFYCILEKPIEPSSKMEHLIRDEEGTATVVGTEPSSSTMLIIGTPAGKSIKILFSSNSF